MGGSERSGRRPEPDVPGRELLRVTVGSHAHGTATPDSDVDQRVVFALPTEDFFQIGQKAKESVWIEHGGPDGNLDITGWEIGHYLKLATQCNPTVLEVLWAPVVSWGSGQGNESGSWGVLLRSIRGSLLNRQRIYDAFGGYSSNQRKKMLGDIGSGEGITWTSRHWKFAAALIRVLHQGIRLLVTGDLPVNLPEGDNEDREVHSRLTDIRQGQATPGKVVDLAHGLQVDLFSAYIKSKLPLKPDLTEAQELLDEVRKNNYSGS